MITVANVARRLIIPAIFESLRPVTAGRHLGAVRNTSNMEGTFC